MKDTMLPEIIAVREGTNVTLQCSPMMVYPAPVITWLMDGSVVQVTTENYTIGPVSEPAIYQCLVEAAFVPSTNKIGLPPTVSFITTTLIDCKRFAVLCDLLYYNVVSASTSYFVTLRSYIVFSSMIIMNSVYHAFSVY